jgi:hypothetical protein
MVLTFHTTTEAMAMEKQCNIHEIPGRLIPVPREITAGCGLAWRMGVDAYGQYEQQMQKLALRYDQRVILKL